MTIRPAQGGFKGYHNYYVADEFFTPDEQHGAVVLRDGQRAARVGEDFITGLHHGMEEEVGSASNLIMYKCGIEWALRDMKRFNERMRHEFGSGKTDIWQMNPRFVLETWWWPLTVSGWGGWKFDLAFDTKGLAVVEIRNSAVAQSMKRVGKPVCHMYAGLFAGCFSFMQKADKQSIEVQCYAMGNDVCKFLVGDERMVNAAEFWRSEGANAGEILGRLQ